MHALSQSIRVGELLPASNAVPFRAGSIREKFPLASCSWEAKGGLKLLRARLTTSGTLRTELSEYPNMMGSEGSLCAMAGLRNWMSFKKKKERRSSPTKRKVQARMMLEAQGQRNSSRRRHSGLAFIAPTTSGFLLLEQKKTTDHPTSLSLRSDRYCWHVHGAFQQHPSRLRQHNRRRLVSARVRRADG